MARHSGSGMLDRWQRTEFIKGKIIPWQHFVDFSSGEIQTMWAFIDFSTGEINPCPHFLDFSTGEMPMILRADISPLEDRPMLDFSSGEISARRIMGISPVEKCRHLYTSLSPPL